MFSIFGDNFFWHNIQENRLKMPLPVLSGFTKEGKLALFGKE